jgi:hypothetical protein
MASRSPWKALPRCSYVICLTWGRFVNQAMWLEDRASKACMTKLHLTPIFTNLLHVLVTYSYCALYTTNSSDSQGNLAFPGVKVACILCSWPHGGKEMYQVKLFNRGSFKAQCWEYLLVLQ